MRARGREIETGRVVEIELDEIVADNITVGRLRFDASSVVIDGRTVALTPQEHKLMVTLAADPSRTWRLDELSSAVLGYQPANPSTRTLVQCIARLRAKLGRGMVANVWGVGYRLGDEAQA